MITAIVLAGGQLKHQPIPKSLIRFKEKTLIEIVIDALNASEKVNEVVVIAPPEAVPFIKNSSSKLKQIINASEDLIERLYKAIEFAESEFLLIVPVDIPLITKEIVDGFIEECLREESDAYYPIISKEILEKRFPGTIRTYAKLKEGVFTGGNMFLIRKSLFEINRPFVEEIFRARKSAYKMAMVAGPRILIKGILRLLTVEEAEKRVSKLFKNARMKAVFTQFPEIGIDVDKEEDIEYLEKLERAQ